MTANHKDDLATRIPAAPEPSLMAAGESTFPGLGPRIRSTIAPTVPTAPFGPLRGTPILKLWT